MLLTKPTYNRTHPCRARLTGEESGPEDTRNLSPFRRPRARVNKDVRVGVQRQRLLRVDKRSRVQIRAPRLEFTRSKFAEAGLGNPPVRWDTRKRNEVLCRPSGHSDCGGACNRGHRNAGCPRSARERGNAGNRLERPHLRNAGGVRSLAEIAGLVLQGLGAPSPVAAVRFRAPSAMT